MGSFGDETVQVNYKVCTTEFKIKM